MASSTVAGVIAVVKVFIFSLLAVPTAYFFDQVFTWTKSHAFSFEIIAASGVAVLLLVALLAYIFFRGTVKETRDPFLYGFALFCFTGVIGLLVGLEYDRKLSGFMGEYIKAGEPYLNSPYGGVICYLDTAILYPLELLMCYFIAARKNYRNIAIYWAAAILQSVVVIVLSALYGKSGPTPSTVLNIGHFVFPIVVGWSFLLTAPSVKVTTTSKLKPIFGRPLDFLLVILSGLSVIVCCIRALVVLGSPVWVAKSYGKLVEPHLIAESPTPFLSTQVLIYFFYFAPLFAVSAYGFIKPGCSWMFNVVLVLGGALLHGQISHILTSIHFNTPKQLQPPSSSLSQALFWAVNLTLLLLPQLLVIRVIFCPGFFFRSGGAAVGGKVSQKIDAKPTAKAHVDQQSKPKVGAKNTNTSAKKAPVVSKKPQNNVKKAAKQSKKVK